MLKVKLIYLYQIEKDIYLWAGKEILKMKTESGYYGTEEEISFALYEDLKTAYEDALVMKEQYCKLNKAAKVIFFPGYIIMRAGAWLEKYSLTFVILAVITFLLAIAKP